MFLHSRHEGVEQPDKVTELEEFLLEALYHAEQLLQLAICGWWIHFDQTFKFF